MEQKNTYNQWLKDFAEKRIDQEGISGSNKFRNLMTKIESGIIDLEIEQFLIKAFTEKEQSSGNLGEENARKMGEVKALNFLNELKGGVPIEQLLEEHFPPQVKAS